MGLTMQSWVKVFVSVFSVFVFGRAKERHYNLFSRWTHQIERSRTFANGVINRVFYNYNQMIWLRFTGKNCSIWKKLLFYHEVSQIHYSCIWFMDVYFL